MIEISQGRLKNRRPLSIIDIGSNSIRLVIYEGIARAPTMLFNEKMLAGLGRGIVTSGELDPDGVRRALLEFKRFRALSEQAGAQQLHVIATAAAREARNGPNFIQQAQEILGTKIHVLTGKEEAYYSALGIISGFHAPDGVVGDQGGGSLELVDVVGETIGDGVTLPLGGLRLEETSKADPQSAGNIARDKLKNVDFLKAAKGRAFYCVGGTWRNLAHLHMTSENYPLHVMHNYEMNPQAILPFLNRVMKGEADKIKGIGEISKSRRALLPYGAAALREIIEVMQPSRIVTSALGVREGYLYHLLNDDQKKEDPLISASEELAILRARSVTHARELTDWTRVSFAALGVEETENEARLRHAACLLADIGWRAHPEYRGVQSLNVIAHAAFVGIDHPGRAYLALANLYRHDGLSSDDAAADLLSLAPDRYIERAKILGGLLRVIYLLTASMAGIIPELCWRREGDEVQLVVPAKYGDLDGERLQGRMNQLAKLVKQKLRLVVKD
ncbi:Ppx/GppA family phosphatase [Limoniibacter endophyticus]|uniref:Exopolyphosphatase n=1 Tax=Limoniibacter endophyticus TaxID=1565040 RepID=A0A8J3DGN9_9HYPH|nr:Ppx/GppA phosphatase family protein [Limoniibacter endophyticus]GHC68483.1 exopolyphosphatase [Limoniibacter endophyticus]